MTLYVKSILLCLVASLSQSDSFELCLGFSGVLGNPPFRADGNRKGTELGLEQISKVR